ncbi:hypothetical protein IV203_038422 [Nitzschia inconspicua]|uniref:Uncharacterized protein n=1 Tax=Nitzschia inconspicua TaxID=303405 RepID=A0A9K3Q1W0_9STRA|nr:hypothetical protein IV203_038422 [Nitzschia inconspicua]
MIQRTVRAGGDTLLNKIVLDDVLKGIYDPESGLIACLACAFVGASTMYGLKMKPEQRCKLVQSSLGLASEQDAHFIMMEPGGLKALLPAAINQWLQPPTSSTDELAVPQMSQKNAQNECRKGSIHGHSHTPGDISIETNSTCCDGPYMEDDIFDGETVRKARGLSFHFEKEKELSPMDDVDDEATERHCPKQRETSSPVVPEIPMHETNPLAVFATILKEMAYDQLKPYAEAFPRSAVENAGMAAATMLFLQLLSRRHSKRHVTLGRLVAVALSSVATISFGSILTREAILGHIHDNQSLKVACRDILLRLAEKMKRNVLSNKTKSFLAMAVLLILGKSPKAVHTHR